MSEPALKVYAIAEVGRCPRCLKDLDLPAGAELACDVCPHCEAVIGVRIMNLEGPAEAKGVPIGGG